MLWVAAWYEDGKKKSRAFKDEQTARAFEQERLARINNAADRLTLGELAAAYFRSKPDLHSTTKNLTIWMLSGRENQEGNHIEAPGEFLRDKFAESLSRQDLERLREGCRVRGVTNSTMNKYQACVHAILAWGAEQDLITRNPWRDYKRLPAQRPAILTGMDDIRKVYAVSPPWMQWAIKTMYALVVRPGQEELFSLQWTAFDWQRNVVAVRQGKSGRMKTVFPPAVYMEEARCRYEEDVVLGIPFVCHKDGKRIFRYAKAWEWAVSKTKLPHFPMYNIRHVAISEALARGADLAAVSAQAGHSSIATTSTFYAHVIAGAQQRVAALMPAIE